MGSEWPHETCARYSQRNTLIGTPGMAERTGTLVPRSRSGRIFHHRGWHLLVLVSRRLTGLERLTGRHLGL